MVVTQPPWRAIDVGGPCVAQSRIYYEKLERVKQSLGRMEVDPKLQARVIKCEEISTRSPPPHPIDTSSAHSRLSFACPGCGHARASGLGFGGGYEQRLADELRVTGRNPCCCWD